MIVTKAIGEGACHISITLTALKLNCISIPDQTITDAVTYEQVTVGANKKDSRQCDTTQHQKHNNTQRSLSDPGR